MVDSFAEAIAGAASAVDAFADAFVVDTFGERAGAIASLGDALATDAFADAFEVAFVVDESTPVVVVVAVEPNLFCRSLSYSMDSASPSGS